MKKLVLLCGALALLALGVRAQTPEYTAKMTRMLELSGSDAVMKELPKQMIGMMKQQVPAMPDSVSRQIEDLMAEYFPKMLEMMTPIYAKYYTEEDLDGLIAFYESPLGKKMASTQPLILKEVMGVVPQWAAVIGRAVVLPGGRSKWGGRLRFGKRRHLDELHRVPTRNLSMKKGRWSMEMRDTYISFAVRIG